MRYTIKHNTRTLEVNGADPGDALERACILYNLPRQGLIAQRKEQ